MKKQTPTPTQARIRQTRPFRSLSQEAVIALLRASNMIEAQVATQLEPYGLTPAQYNVLRILRGAGDALPTMEISQRMVHRTPGITRLIDRLEASGLLRRERSSEDRRQVFCRITSDGLTLLRRLDPVIDELDDETLAHLSKTELQTLIDTLESIQKRLD